LDWQEAACFSSPGHSSLAWVTGIIDYRCGNEKILLSWGDMLVSPLHSWRLQNSKNTGH
jgi:hypothetical protein